VAEAMPIQPPGGANPIPAGQSSGQSSATEPSQATPDANAVYRVGSGVSPPRLITSVDPEYTDLARKKKISGICTVEMVIDADGNPQGVRVIKSIGKDLNPKLKKAAEGLDQSAVNAVSQYRFKPAEYQGKPVPVRVKIEVSFKMF
jgi:TonB family protein